MAIPIQRKVSLPLLQASTTDIRCIVLRSSLTRHHVFNDAYRIMYAMDEWLAEIEALLG